jgi:hypothetical protein
MAQAIYANSTDLNATIPDATPYMSGTNDEEYLKNRKFCTSEAILSIVKTSLERFQKGFYNFQKGQIIRFLLFDILVPLVLTGIAFFMLFINFFPVNNV